MKRPTRATGGKRGTTGKPAAKGAKKKASSAKKAAKKAPVKKKATTKKRAAAGRVAKKPAAAKKATAKKATAKKATAKKATAKKATAKKATAKRTTRKTAAKKPAGRTASTKAPKTRRAGTATDAKGKKNPGQAPTLRPLSARAHKAGVAMPPPAPASSKRNFGLRGAAPWVARHAAKRAEELRKRNAEPPPPGSARATLRIPPQAEQIKNKIAELHLLTSKVRGLRKKFERNFYEIGEVLAIVQRKQLHEAKGYSSFDSFLEREIDLPRSMSLRLIRVAQTFQRETAYDFGVERLTSALAALDGELTAAPASHPHPSSRGFSSTALPQKPPIRFED
ncbi:MAG: hypothetical protein JRI68_33945 [Deltaproteobacteria bacterium]|nr:hypothetical protein [Deltaproteobacteria bacterium]